MRPIEIFSSQDQIDECVKWWQEKLFLTNWIVKAEICPPDEFKVAESVGENVFDMVNQSCVIRILKPEFYGERIMRYCAEKVLVHELLHCKYNWIYNESSYEGKYVDTIEHGLLEQMAKSLIMAKYNLTLNYFKS